MNIDCINMRVGFETNRFVRCVNTLNEIVRVHSDGLRFG